MKRFLALLTVPLALVLFVAPGLAQMEMDGPMWAFGAHAGYALPMGDFGDGYDGAIMAGVTGCYMFTEMYGLELGADWNKFAVNDDVKEEWEALDPDFEDLTLQIIPVTLDFVATFPAGDFMPYVKGGLGMYFWTSKYESGGDSEDTSENDFGINGAVGVKIPVAETTMFNVGAAFHHIMTEDESTQYFTIGAGVSFLF
jgi:outer membrane protein W